MPVPAGPFQPAFISVFDMPALHARQRPDDCAFADGDNTLTWREFNERVNCLANALIDGGLKQGDTVAVLAGNSIWAYLVIFAIARAGGVVCPLSSLLMPRLLASLVEDAGADRMLVEHPYRSLATEVSALSPQLRLIHERGDGDDDYAMLTAQASAEHPDRTCSAQDPSNIIYSSGTTGRPKGIVHSHRARVGFATQLGMGLRMHTQCRTLLTTPPNSNGTWMVMLPTVMLGGATLVMGGFSVDGFCAAMNTLRPTHTFVVPTQAGTLLEDPRHREVDYAGLECMVTAGAPMPERVKSGMRALTGERLYELWGFTESVGTIIAPREMAERPGSVGRSWIGGELRIIDGQDRDVSGQGTGEIVGRSISMMAGYLNRPDANEEIVWRDEQDRLYFRTGDIGELDADGYLTLRGRAKDMILSGGLNVFPIDIEAVLLEHEAVRDAAVVGVDDEKWGEVPVAFVIPRQNQPLNSAELRQWLNQRLAKFQRVADLVVRPEDFPRNTLGKVLKNDLKADYRRSGSEQAGR